MGGVAREIVGGEPGRFERADRAGECIVPAPRRPEQVEVEVLELEPLAEEREEPSRPQPLLAPRLRDAGCAEDLDRRRERSDEAGPGQELSVARAGERPPEPVRMALGGHEDRARRKRRRRRQGRHRIRPRCGGVEEDELHGTPSTLTEGRTCPLRSGCAAIAAPDSKWNMPFERRCPIWLCTELVRPLNELWPSLKMFI